MFKKNRKKIINEKKYAKTLQIYCIYINQKMLIFTEIYLMETSKGFI